MPLQIGPQCSLEQNVKILAGSDGELACVPAGSSYKDAQRCHRIDNRTVETPWDYSYC